LWRQEIALLPSLAGEEALDALAQMQANKRAIVGTDEKDHQ